MNSKVLIFLGLVALVAADSRPRPAYSYGAPRADSGSEESFESSEAKYEFSWEVDEDSNEFGHQEARDGDDTQGSYYVQLPDGRLQKVTYHVDGDDGYIAEVTYEGEAQFPSEEESNESGSFEAPRYAPPRRSYFAPDSNESK